MFPIYSYKEAFDFHQKLVRCWFMRKLKGGKSHKNGHKCLEANCLVCTSSEHIQRDVPMKLKKFLLANNNIDILVSGLPTELLKLIVEFEKIKFSARDKKKIKFFFIEAGYENWFQRKYSKIFLDKLDRDTCTYCNKNYTLNLVDDRARAELDHWFPKNQFCILSLSFYNLIPSCHSCNHLKGSPNISWTTALDNFVHPYLLEKDQSFKFDFQFDKSSTDYKVIIEVRPNSKIAKTIKEIQLEEIYSANSNKELKDLIDLKYKYSENYIDILINKTFKGVLTEEEVYRMVFGVEITQENYHKRPFSKFKHDIIESLLRIK